MMIYRSRRREAALVKTHTQSRRWDLPLQLSVLLRCFCVELGVGVCRAQCGRAAHGNLTSHIITAWLNTALADHS